MPCDEILAFLLGFRDPLLALLNRVRILPELRPLSLSASLFFPSFIRDGDALGRELMLVPKGADLGLKFLSLDVEPGEGLEVELRPSLADLPGHELQVVGHEIQSSIARIVAPSLARESGPCEPRKAPSTAERPSASAPDSASASSRKGIKLKL